MKPPNIFPCLIVLSLILYVFALRNDREKCNLKFKRSCDHDCDDDGVCQEWFEIGEDFNSIACSCWCRDNRLGCSVKDLNLTEAYLHFEYCNFKAIELLDNNKTVLKMEQLSLPNYDQIEALSLSFSKVEKIEDYVFDRFVNLTKLKIENSLLKTINDKILSEQIGSTLEKLDLSNNELQNLSATTFQYLTNLKHLDLQDNQRLNLESEINGTNVTIFHQALSNLQILDLSFCMIKVVNDDAFIYLRSLDKLILSRNPLTIVPKTIRSLSKLQHLEFEQTFIKAVQDCDFCDLPNLKILNFYRSKNLTYLDENAFGSISTGMIPDLAEFLISNSNVSVIPEKLLNWKNVSKIEFNGNPLTCGCDMAWLINDLSAAKSLYANNLVQPWMEDKFPNYGYFFSCHDNSTFNGIPFSKFNGSLCNGNNFNLTEIIKEKDEKYYVCGDPKYSELRCSCSGSTLQCGNFKNRKILHTNIKSASKNFIHKVDIYRSNITILQKNKILPDHETTIKKISITNSNINCIEKEAFDNLPFLEVLNLNENNLTIIEIGVFTEKIGSTLLELSLEENHLQLLPADIFDNLTKLESLFLGTNLNILSTSENFFSKSLSNLKNLRLKDCNISNLDDDMFLHLTNLKTLDISINPLNSIPTTIKKLDLLEKLIFTLTNLKVINDCDFCAMKNLNTLELDQNFDLSYIHENAFGVVESKNKNFSLESFTFSKCNISYLSEKLLNSKNVTNFIFNDNPWRCDCSMAWLIKDIMGKKTNPRYKDFDEYICHAPSEMEGISMEDLVVSKAFCSNSVSTEIDAQNKTVYYVSNKDDKNSKCFKDYKTLYCHSLNHLNILLLNSWPMLEDFDFKYFKIKFLNFDNMLPEMRESVRHISITHSNIEKIRPGTFDSFPSLTSLNLANNLLSEINENILTKTIGPDLYSLDLSYNRFKTFKLSTFENLNALETLKLAYNPELNFTDLSFSTSLKCLRTLDLSGCNISTLPDNIFVNLTNLQSLDLSFNPITTIPSTLNVFRKLNDLDISGTKITVLKTNQFQYTPSLKSLYAKFSNLERIEDCAFCSLPKFGTVNLHHSKRLSFIHENAFGTINNSVKGREYITFIASECNLTILPEKLLNLTADDERVAWDDYVMFIRFDVKHNPFKCGAENEWLMKRIKNQKYHGARYQCYSTPENYGGQFFNVAKSFLNNISSMNGFFFGIILFVSIIAIVVLYFCFSRKVDHHDNESYLNADFDIFKT